MVTTMALPTFYPELYHIIYEIASFVKRQEIGAKLMSMTFVKES